MVSLSSFPPSKTNKQKYVCFKFCFKVSGYFFSSTLCPQALDSHWVVHFLLASIPLFTFKEMH